ncbi:putative F-box/LRR-repeat protein At5g02930 [Lolium rigidum]|uniref:putative F-box/LRR-repeat protein At5g02930 n=1 Tax=Lolium rigidum TaxID=89674 RepID=UPI001F5D577C|nr:putative F-box/LRR-repeat protein At5g02930 [Lolium rigidum]
MGTGFGGTGLVASISPLSGEGVGSVVFRPDRISDLSDAVLGEIISLLPTKEGARTQILASRWRNLWRSAPLNLDCCGLTTSWGEVAGVVSRILSSHQGPGRCFRILSGFCPYEAATVDSWLQSPAIDNLQELCLSYRRKNQSPLPLLPESFLRFSTTLRVATIEHCHLLDSIVQGLQFPQLRQLTLSIVRISECSVPHVIAGCPALECLMIRDCFGFRRLGINSISLRSVGVHAEYYRDELNFGELIIENAPCLEKLLHLGCTSDLHVSVIFAPKLETMRCCSNPTTKTSFGSMVIQGLHIDGLTTVVRTIKFLSVDMDKFCLDTIINLMRCFPCLEKLYIQSYLSGPKNLWLSKHKNFINGHDIRLKKIMFKMYRGTRSQVSFVTFFVLNARVLESMILQIEHKNDNEEFLAEHRRKLQLENRASRGARFQFTTDKCVRNVWDINDARVLDLADPFACLC